MVFATFFGKLVEKMREILIIGGGASGMAAAIKAAEDPSVHVTLLERQARVGRKLLATGNGRCNLTNRNAAPQYYHGGPGFPDCALQRWSPERVLEFFARLGLETVTEYGGRVFPMSDHAGSVLDVLRLALEQPNVTLRCAAPVTALRRVNSGFCAECGDERLRAQRVIVACGGCAGAKLGGVGDGYTLLQSLGHSRTPLYPALTPIRTRPELPRAMKGVRVQALIRALRRGRELGRSRGDVLFTETGVSGTAVFDLSRAVSAAGEGTELELDLFPDTEEEALRALLCARRALWPEIEANRILTGTVHSRVGQTLCKAAGLSGAERISALTDARLAALAGLCKQFTLPVTGVSGFDAAQVTAGGVRTEEFDPETMESRIVPGLFACGEVLDVDGECGGFNLQWAWASGLLAGESV